MARKKKRRTVTKGVPSRKGTPPETRGTETATVSRPLIPGTPAHRPAPAASPLLSRRTLMLAAALVLLVGWAYARVRTFDFVNFDDDVYVTANPYVRDGFTAESTAWALTTGHGSNWHPLTWFSLMLDTEMHGVNASGFHLTSLLLHILNTVLLFFLLARMTGRIFAGAMVAALFGVHPLHVESVAWVAERKDVLSTFFLFLTLWAYVKYTETPAPPQYAAVVVLLALGLMAKPMLVTLPFLLLLLDYWPLRRFGFGPGGLPGALRTFTPLVREKAPLFGVALVSSVVTFLVQQRGGAVGSLEVYPFPIRAANAVVAYAAYLVKMFWPTGLTFFYPHPLEAHPAWQVLGAGAALGVVTALVLWAGRRAPYLPVGWFWYLGTLVPVIGLVQVGEQSMADRYTYIPLIGVFIMVVWPTTEWTPGARRRTALLAVLAAAVLAPLTLATRRQAATWRNDLALCEKALRVTTNNFKAHSNLGLVMERQGDFEQAIQHYTRAVEIKPNHERHYNLGNAYRKQGDLDAAVEQYREALKIRPGYPKAHNNLGAIYFQQGDVETAREHYEQAVRASPESAEFHNNLGAAYQRLGYLDRAIAEYGEALRLFPGYPSAQDNLNKALQVRNR